MSILKVITPSLAIGENIMEVMGEIVLDYGKYRFCDIRSKKFKDIEHICFNVYEKTGNGYAHCCAHIMPFNKRCSGKMMADSYLAECEKQRKIIADANKEYVRKWNAGQIYGSTPVYDK